MDGRADPARQIAIGHARAGARGWVARLREKATPGGVSLLIGLSAAASAEIWLPALASAGAVGAAALIASLGGNLLASAVEDTWRGAQDPDDLPGQLEQVFARLLSPGHDEVVRLAFEQEIAQFLTATGVLDEARHEAGDDHDLTRALTGLTTVVATGQQILSRQLRTTQERVDRYAEQQRAVGEQILYVEQLTLAEIRRFTTVPDSPTVRPPTTLPPYPGLRPLGAAESAAGYFHGRDQVLAALLTRLAAQARSDPGVLFVTGASGVGKTSLLHAGLIPALAAGVGPVAHARQWPVLRLTPGHRPLPGLAARVCTAAGVSAGGVATQLLENPMTMVDVLGQVPCPDPARVLVAVDQAEELFTHGCPPAERRAFLAALLAAGRSGRAVVVIGFRADFYERLAAEPDLARTLENDLFLVTPPGRDELRQIVEGPAHAAGLTLENGLTESLLDDCAPESLPLLAHTLRRLYDERDGDTLTRGAYAALGGLSHAVAATAENLYEELDPGGRTIVRQLLLAMIGIGDGTHDTRRHVPTDDLLALFTDGRSTARAVLGRLVEERLVTAGQSTCALTHEAVITAWPRLQGWLSDDRGGLRLHQDLRQAATAWNRQPGDPDSLWTGPRLDTVTAWAADHPGALTALDRAFLDAGQTRRAALATAAQRRHRNLRLTAATLAVLLVLASGLAVLAVRQAQDARRTRDVALARQLTEAADGLLDENTRLATLLALEADRLDPTPDTRALLTAAAYEPTGWTVAAHTTHINAIDFSPDGTLAATAGGDGTARLLDTGTGRTVRTLTVPDTYLDSIAFSPDGDRLATGDGNGAVQLWDPATGEQIRVLRTGSDRVNALSFSPDGQVLATGGWAEADLWSTTTGRRLRALEHVPHGDFYGRVVMSPDGRTVATALTGEAILLRDARTGEVRQILPGRLAESVSLVYSPDGRTLATLESDENRVRVWDVQDGTHVTLPDESLVDAITFSPDGNLVTINYDGVTRLWDTTTHRSVRTYTADPRPYNDVAVSADGRLFATAAGDGTVHLWRANSGALAGATLEGTENWLNSVTFSADGATLATTGNATRRTHDETRSATVQVWDTATRRLRRALTEHAGTIGGLALGPDGNTVAVGYLDGTTRLWPTTRDGEAVVLRHHTDNVSDLEFTADGTTLATASWDGTTALWDVRTGELRHVLDSGSDEVQALALRPDGRTLATADHRGDVRLWDTGSGRLLTVLTGHTDTVNALGFSPDGSLLVTASGDGTARLWDAVTGQPGPVLSGHTDEVTRVAFSPDGSLVATAGEDSTVQLWDPSSGARVRLLNRQPESAIELGIGDLEFSPDGRRLAAGDEELARVWDVGTGRLLTSFAGNLGSVDDLAFSPDSRLLATAGESASAQLWDTRVDDSPESLCERAGRNLTPSEWRQYVGGPYHTTCPGE